MQNLFYHTVSSNKSNAQKEWLVVNAEGQSLGRLSSKVAKLLRGKHKVNFTPHADCGDYVIVINAEKIQLTGSKWTQKEYQHYTGFPGGQRSIVASKLFDKNPSIMIEKSVKGMLMKNKLGRSVFKNLYIFNGSEHNQQAQQPKEVNLNEFK